MLKGTEEVKLKERAPALFYSSEDKTLALCVSTPSNWNVCLRSVGELQLEAWNHVICTCSNLELNLYLNGVKDATLPADLELPANVRTVDFLPYDAALEYADVFVSNGGYGGMMHGVINAVPMVVAGITEDKVEVTARAEWAGFAVNLKTQTPEPEVISAAADKIFADKRYKTRAIRLMQENQDLDSLSIIEREIMKYARKD